MQRLGSACTWLLVLALVGGATGSPPTTDPDVAKGIQQFEEGYYDQAALTLDAAIPRLAGNAAATASLQQAYIYLGAACVGLDQRDKAKAQFRSAISLMVVQPGGKRGTIKDLTLRSFGFSPKIASAFEEAKREARAEAGEKDSGMSLPLTLGGIAVAGGGAALLATKGSTNTPTTPPPTLAPAQPTAEIKLLGVAPASGSTISLAGAQPSRPVVVFTATLSVLYNQSGAYRLSGFASFKGQGADPGCILGNTPVSLTAGSAQTVTVSLRYPGSVPCPSLPFDVTGLAARLGWQDRAGTLLGGDFAVSYHLVP